ncbi:TIM barrel protein [Porphyromonas gingivalis]|uniref:TIM barrel protein n=1 Tax=Porphyromonas gingivalis TaxID=837 RepID=A0AAF0BDP3_PORGN|nr:TIM barrel protein [Porphyromonas gingivalis]AIJ35234.1 hypothetical protein EG14_03940 [Porphyromonas gingivalis]WCF98148.1 TIM barrel protein [Porphyromonas gingivalis]
MKDLQTSLSGEKAFKKELLNKRLGFSFYALRIEQATRKLINDFSKAEAILFSKKDLLGKKFLQAWQNIEKIGREIGFENMSFHFPMNDCDYVHDDEVFEILVECIKICESYEIPIVVLHPNIRYLISEWKQKNIQYLQAKLFDRLYTATSLCEKVTICLENMPPIGNQFDDGDILFLNISDVINRTTKKLKLTWDINHYFNVVETMKIATSDSELRNFLPRYFNCDYFDFKCLIKDIHHWHFSAFDKIANPFSKKICIEGIVPRTGLYNYKEALNVILNEGHGNIILEINEVNYTRRENIYKMKSWCYK